MSQPARAGASLGPNLAGALAASDRFGLSYGSTRQQLGQLEQDANKLIQTTITLVSKEKGHTAAEIWKRHLASIGNPDDRYRQCQIVQALYSSQCQGFHPQGENLDRFMERVYPVYSRSVPDSSQIANRVLTELQRICDLQVPGFDRDYILSQLGTSHGQTALDVLDQVKTIRTVIHSWPELSHLRDANKLALFCRYLFSAGERIQEAAELLIIAARAAAYTAARNHPDDEQRARDNAVSNLLEELYTYIPLHLVFSSQDQIYDYLIANDISYIPRLPNGKIASVIGDRHTVTSESIAVSAS